MKDYHFQAGEVWAKDEILFRTWVFRHFPRYVLWTCIESYQINYNNERSLLLLSPLLLTFVPNCCGHFVYFNRDISYKMILHILAFKKSYYFPLLLMYLPRCGHHSFLQIHESKSPIILNTDFFLI